MPMSCSCQICGTIITSSHRAVVEMVPGAKPIAADQRAEIEAIAEFDLHAARVAEHIGTFHPEHAAAMASIQFLAMKVYAMTWTDTAVQGAAFRKIRAQWQKEILQQIARQELGDAPAPPAPALPGAAAGSSGTASTE